MDATTEPLDELLMRDEQLKSLGTPVLLLFGLTIAGAIGVLTQAMVLSIVGWFGPWIIGPWVVSRAAPALGTPPLVKYPLFLSCAMPLLSLAAPLYVWQASRSARAELQAQIRQLQAIARRRPAAPAVAPAAAERAPVQQALPVLRAVADGGWSEGQEVKLQLSQALPPGMTDRALPPARASHGIFAVGYHVDAGSHWTSVGRDDMKDAGLDLDTLHRQALSNLMKLVKGKPGLRLVEGHPYYGVLLDGDHEACLVLLDGIWEALFADKTPNGAVVGIPTRDVLAFCDARSAEGIAALREANARLADAKGAVFPGLLLRRDGRWSVLD